MADEQVQSLAAGVAFDFLSLMGFSVNSLLFGLFHAGSRAPPRRPDWPDGHERRWGAVGRAATCALTPLVLCVLSESSSGL